MSTMEWITSSLKGDSPLLFFGAGQNAAAWIDILSKQNQAPVAVIDETLSKQGGKISSVPIVSPEVALKNWGKHCTVLSTIFVPNVAYHSLRKKIMAFGFEKVGVISQLLHFFPDSAFYYFLGKPAQTKFQKAADDLLLHFVDPISREHAQAFIQAQTCLDPSFNSSPRPQDYFLKEWVNIPEGIGYVDAGAYHGDTIQRFFELHPFTASEILAFEPDPTNFVALDQYVNTLQESQKNLISLKNLAVGKEQSKIKFHTLGNASSRSCDSGDVEVDAISLDEFLDPNKAYFIKFDVEGAEMDALLGCEKMVRSGRSMIGVSVYHRPNDWLDASEFLLKNFPNCQLFFRTLDENGMDAMLYALPREWVKQK